MLRVTTLEQAQKQMLACLETEGCRYNRIRAINTIPLEQAVGRILAEDVFAKKDVPSFDRSTVDGFAVRAADTFGASASLPAALRFAGEIAMGSEPEHALSAHQCMGIATGGALPIGADAVIMLEDVESVPDDPDPVRYLYKSVSPGQNLIFRGDDIRQNERLLPAGTRLMSHHIGALAALGLADVPVLKRITAGLVSTGDELVPPGQKLLPGQVHDVNTPLLTAMMAEAGVETMRFGIVPDVKNKLTETIRQAWQTCDLVIVSGGSSAGARDHVAEVISGLGKPGLLMHGLAVKPGKPTLLGYADQVPVIGLPGHPVAACFMAEQLVLPLIDRMYQRPVRRRKQIQARLKSRIPSNHGRQTFVPVRLAATRTDALPLADPLTAKSGLITALRSSDGYITIDRDCEGLNEQTIVTVHLWGGYEYGL